MTRSRERFVRVAQLKARLSEYLRAARRGQSVTVMDRDTPIARLVPLEHAEGLVTRRPLRSLRDVVLPPPLERPIDSLGALLEERQTRR